MTRDLQELLFGAFPLLYRNAQDDKPLRPWALSERDLLYWFPEDGWFDLIFEMSERLEDQLRALPRGKRFHAVQIKEKFGVLRVYLEPGGRIAREAARVVAEAVAQSARTCEVCSAPGQLDKRLFWWKALCERHAEEQWKAHRPRRRKTATV